ncbi:Bidirectional sugar transporter [Nymphaea thermarum]|nr:Bidirectional sugar transporter [Nymphaea thermarum]
MVPTFYRIWRKGSVEDFSPIPYLATVLNCAVWVLYGLPFVHPHSILVTTINGIGLAIEFFYLLLYFTYSTKQQKVKPLLILSVELIFMATVVTVTLAALHTYESRSLMVGILGIIFGTCMYASPLSVMIPNGLGAALGATQLILYGCYYSSPPKKTRTGVTVPPKQEIQLPYGGSVQGNEGKAGV